MAKFATLQNRDAESIRQFVHHAQPDEIIQQFINDSETLRKAENKNFVGREIGDVVAAGIVDDVAAKIFVELIDKKLDIVAKQNDPDFSFSRNPPPTLMVINFETVAKNSWELARIFYNARNKT